MGLKLTFSVAVHDQIYLVNPKENLVELTEEAKTENLFKLL